MLHAFNSCAIRVTKRFFMHEYSEIYDALLASLSAECIDSECTSH